MITRRRAAGGGLAALLLAALCYWWQALPQPLFRQPLSTLLLDSQGQLLGATLAADQQWRLPLAAELPERYQQALLAFEDRRFFYHPGVDPLALGRALFSNSRAGRVVSGGSTLSMQLVRMARGNPPRRYGEKLWEMLLALRLELAYSKAEILHLYAANAPQGGNLVGLESAAWAYFQRPAGELSWAEAALLAVLPNSPGLLRPGRGQALLKAKRDRLLQRLHGAGAFDALALRLALAEPLPLAAKPLAKLAPQLLQTAVASGQRGRLQSTIDGTLQRQLQATVAAYARQLAMQGVNNSAALIIDNRQMQVLAYVGNSPLIQGPPAGHALDLLQRPRSSGSILKPFLYALMLQDGRLLPDTLVADIPTQIDGYVPENFDRQYRGALPAAEALALSLNIPAVRMLRDYGLARFQQALTAMGLTTLFRPPEQYGLTLILGGAEVTPWQVGLLYANLARISRGGVGAGHYQPLQWQPQANPVAMAKAAYGPGAAWLTLEAMQEVNRPGDAQFWRNFASSRRLAWKTGTSYGLRDAWAVGNSDGYTVVVWAGNASGGGVAGLSGGQTAAPLLLAIHQQLPRRDWFVAPTADLQALRVCAADGYLPRADCPASISRAPRGSHFQRISPYHQQIHTDASGRYRVHGSCYPLAQLQRRSWFQLPPAMAYYYQRHHSDYRQLPPWHPDCAPAGAEQPLALLYPPAGSKLYLPLELDGLRHEAVFEAVHAEPQALLYWHLDGRYLGQTRAPHQQLIAAAAGSHQLVLVDEAGRRLERRFEILGTRAGRCSGCSTGEKSPQ